MTSSDPKTPQIGIIMGSDSDLPTMNAALEICQQFQVSHEVAIASPTVLLNVWLTTRKPPMNGD